VPAETTRSATEIGVAVLIVSAPAVTSSGPVCVQGPVEISVEPLARTMPAPEISAVTSRSRAPAANASVAPLATA
jgi:hypothetical protein